jgi:hypothetical protein
MIRKSLVIEHNKKPAEESFCFGFLINSKNLWPVSSFKKLPLPSFIQQVIIFLRLTFSNGRGNFKRMPFHHKLSPFPKHGLRVSASSFHSLFHHNTRILNNAGLRSIASLGIIS